VRRFSRHRASLLKLLARPHHRQSLLNIFFILLLTYALLSSKSSRSTSPILIHTDLRLQARDVAVPGTEGKAQLRLRSPCHHYLLKLEGRLRAAFSPTRQRRRCPRLPRRGRASYGSINHSQRPRAQQVYSAFRREGLLRSDVQQLLLVQPFQICIRRLYERLELSESILDCLVEEGSLDQCSCCSAFRIVRGRRREYQ